ncbi:MAG: hypothetical protein ACRD9S_16225 [Pyrinomonadaceae bacterium]
MAAQIKTPELYLWILRTISLSVPKKSRREWRREWEAEILNRWLLLKEWERLTPYNEFDLFKRVLGSTWDVVCFQQWRIRLVLVTLNVLVALSTGYGALQQFIIRGIRDRELQPLLLSLAAIMVSLLFITSGIALLQRWFKVRQLITLTGTLSILLHVYGVLPPHRNMGFPVLFVGAGYGLVMLVVFRWNENRNLAS